MAWCGTFSSTKDGLPFIGNWPGKERIFFDLGYGGNGITFSMIGAQIICHKLQDIKDERSHVFGYDRIENIGKTDKKKRPLSVHSFRYGFHGFNLPRVIRA